MRYDCHQFSIPSHVYQTATRRDLPLLGICIWLIIYWMLISVVLGVLIKNVIAVHAFFYEQHFYKQRQAEIGKKSSKR